MSRTRADAPITTRNARRQLKSRKKAYLRTLSPGIAVGYRRKERGGSWVASEYLGGGRYREEEIAAADDAIDANGRDVLDFEQAKKAAAATIASWRARDWASIDGKLLSVGDAVEAYIVS